MAVKKTETAPASTASALWDALPTDTATPAPVADAPVADAAPSVDNIADEVPAATGAPAAAVVEGGQRQRTQESVLKKSLELEFNANPDLKDRRCLWSASAKLIHGFGFSDNGSYIDTTKDTILAAVGKGIVKAIEKTDTTTECFLVVDKANGEIISGTVRKRGTGDSYEPTPQRLKDGTKLPKEFVKKRDVPQMVGYALQNIGTEPIEAYYAECSLNNSGVWEENPPTKVQVKPGEVIQLTKKTYALTSSMIEYSCKFANGKAVSRKKNVDAAAIVQKISFLFYADEDEFASVHSEPFKIRIDATDKDGYFRVQDEYKKVFAFLENNGKNKNARASASVRSSLDTTDTLAKLIRDSYKSGAIM